MRYWVYINDKVEGPFEEDKLVTLEGFTPETLLCSEEIEEGGSQEWVKASSIFEFDEAGKTMTRAPLSQNELNIVNPEEAQPPQDTALPVDASATQILIEKIDKLTREIEGMKGKLDAALAASAAAQAAVTQHTLTAVPLPEIPQPTVPEEQPKEPVTEDALITSTESLVNHAEQLVAQASTTSAGKPVDFLDEIAIGEEKNESLNKAGEEVVLRSALDSLYGEKIQTEQEKESTFQDLLSPIKVAAAAATAGAAVAAAAALGDDKEEEPKQEESDVFLQEQTVSTEESAQEPEFNLDLPGEELSSEPAAEPIAEPVALQQEAPAEEITEEQREEIINELTAPSQQSNAILQAIEEAQRKEAPAEIPAQEESKADLADLEALAPAVAPELNLDLPVADESAASEPIALQEEKNPLDLSDQPQLSVVQGQEEVAQPVAQEDVNPVPNQLADELTPMNPDAPKELQQEITETVKELVPGKKLEAPKEEGIISQKDLDEAFTERHTETDFTVALDNAEAKPQAEKQPAQEEEQQEQEQPYHAPYTPGEMTEVELKEGSTYLISDFIPSAEAPVSSAAALAAVAAATSAENGQNNSNATTVEVPKAETILEEIVPLKKADNTDITMSKVILENTIKTKRGATMDIKTVPMVQEPSNTERLDLTDSELDINAQHDIKAADIKPSSSNLTKMVLGGLVALICIAVIYVMLAYLELLPTSLNFLKKEAVEETIVPAEQLDEMLGMEDLADDSLPLQQIDDSQALPPLQADQINTALPPAQAPVNAVPNAQTGNPLPAILSQVQNFRLGNGQTLQQLINSRHPAMQNLIEWNITTAVEPGNYSILVKVPPENPQSFKISYRFNYNVGTKGLDPTISDSKNLLDSIRPQ